MNELDDLPNCICGHPYNEHAFTVGDDGQSARFDGKCSACDCTELRIYVAAPRNNCMVFGVKG
jgi:hypothetical protein